MELNKRKKRVTEEKENIIKLLQESYDDTCNFHATVKRERNKSMKLILTKEDAAISGKYVNDLLKHESTAIDKKIKIVEVLKSVIDGNSSGDDVMKSAMSQADMKKQMNDMLQQIKDNKNVKSN